LRPSGAPCPHAPLHPTRQCHPATGARHGEPGPVLRRTCQALAPGHPGQTPVPRRTGSAGGRATRRRTECGRHATQARRPCHAAQSRVLAPGHPGQATVPRCTEPSAGATPCSTGPVPSGAEPAAGTIPTQSQSPVPRPGGPAAGAMPLGRARRRCTPRRAGHRYRGRSPTGSPAWLQGAHRVRRDAFAHFPLAHLRRPSTDGR
jgi:hypothetical protein